MEEGDRDGGGRWGIDLSLESECQRVTQPGVGFPSRAMATLQLRHAAAATAQVANKKPHPQSDTQQSP